MRLSFSCSGRNTHDYITTTMMMTLMCIWLTAVAAVSLVARSTGAGLRPPSTITAIPQTTHVVASQSVAETETADDVTHGSGVTEAGIPLTVDDVIKLRNPQAANDVISAGKSVAETEPCSRQRMQTCYSSVDAQFNADFGALVPNLTETTLHTFCRYHITSRTS